MTLARLRDFIRRNVVDTVPDAMDMCLSCGKPACSAAEYAHCVPRLARAAELGQAAGGYTANTASASLTTASSAPGAKGEASPADRTSSVKGAEPPRPHSAT
jgi:hypothetical protein